ncbi:zinc metalloproteinase nas-4-like [Glandiceps talaboti]
MMSETKMLKFVVVALVLAIAGSSPIPDLKEQEIHREERDVDDPYGDIDEPIIAIWPDLPTDTRIPQFDAQTKFGEDEEDAMKYILLENENIATRENGFFEGDIFIGPMIPRNAISGMNKKWPNARVPYQIYGFDSGAVARIQAAINEYHTHTCMRWVTRTNERDYVRFVPKSGCWSAVGRTGGMQELSVGGSCNWSRGTIMHEMMHAAGFHHEQTRQDRDSYVTIYWQNIQRGMEYNFQKYALDPQGTQYDYYSIMHYPRNAFSNNGRDTIVPRQSVQIGNRNSFSQTDIQELNKLYSCSGTGTGTGGNGDCQDKHGSCSTWASAHCNSNQYKVWMAENCKKSCNKCDDDDEDGGGGNGNCVDNHNNCGPWAESGECEKNPDWMLPNCKKSCDQCGGGQNCKDKNTNCQWWSGQGFCQGTHASYMSNNCPKSCNSCGNSAYSESCNDYNTYCNSWSQSGECSKNPLYMMDYCRRSCGWC